MYQIIMEIKNSNKKNNKKLKANNGKLKKRTIKLLC